MWMIIGSCLGIFYQTLQKPQMREKAMLLFKKYHPNKTKQNETLAQRESGNRYETNKQNKPRKNENLYKNGRKANLKVVQVRIIES